METLNPTLRLILCLREGLEKGESPRQSLQSFIATDQSELSSKLKSWWIAQEAKLTEPRSLNFSQAQRVVLNLLKRSFQGEPIGASLLSLQQEIAEKCLDEIEEHVQGLPFKTLLPLLFLVFPAYLVLLLGPLVEELLKSLHQ